MATIVSDFTGANENPLSDGGKWGAHADGSGQLQRLNNTVSGTATNTKSVWLGNDFDDIQSIEVSIAGNFISSNRLRLYIRDQNSALGANGYLLVLDGAVLSECRIKSVVDGIESTRVSSVTIPSPGDLIRFEASGNTVKYFLNAVEQASWTDAGNLFPSGRPVIGVNGFTSGGVTLDSCQVTGAIAGPTISNIDTDNDVFPAQSNVVATGTSFGAFSGLAKLELINSAATAIVDQALSAPNWTDAAITIPTIIQAGLQYTNDHKVKVTDSAGQTNELTFTLSPATGIQYINVVNPITELVGGVRTSAFVGVTPTVTTGAQWEAPTTTDQGQALTIYADGTFDIAAGGATEQAFTIRIWDQNDSTWSSMEIVTVNGAIQGDTRKKRRKQTYTALMYHRKYWRDDFIDEDEK